MLQVGGLSLTRL
jgi:hypothetical protein